MNQVIGTVTGLLVLIVALPAVAELAQAALPPLIALLILAAFVRLAWPSSGRWPR